MPRVSGIICVRDQARFIGQAVRSIIQNGVDELVVYDDGSTDGSLERAVEAWCEAGDATVDLHVRRATEPRGIGAAHNAANRMATGDIFALLDADDYWLPSKLQKQLALLGDRRDAVVITKVEQFLEGVSCPKIMRPETIGVPLSLPLPSNMICHREVFERVGDFDETLVSANDVDWFRRAFLGGIEKLEVPEVLVMKRIHGRNLSLHQGHDMVRQLMKVIAKKVGRAS